MRVIGTAGHVDHGKSTLIAALTGVHPDRLKEEQAREMTIELGFGWLDLPNGEQVGIVDVPGHRDFIGNMLAGVGGLDLVMLVIAADEGVMPQTREHLAILDLLQIPSGLVVISKVDMIEDAEWLDLLKEDIRRALAGTVLADAPFVAVSARTGSGLPELVAALQDLLETRPPRTDLGRPRLPIDRVFSMAGFGTVVTGTLADGQFKVGDEVEIQPGGRKTRIRGLQTHKQKEEIALPGSRTAVNLTGLAVEEVQRGQVVVRLGQYNPTQRLDTRLRVLGDISTLLKHGMEVKVFHGTTESLGRLRLLGDETLPGGREAWVQLELRDPLVAVRGDRFILRRPSPSETLGGGLVVDAHPKRRHKRFDEGVLGRLDSLLRGTPGEVLQQSMLALGPASLKEVVLHSRLDPDAAQAGVQELIDANQLVTLEDGALLPFADVLVASGASWNTLAGNILTTLQQYHSANPLRRGIPREELKSRLKLSPRLFGAAVRMMIAKGKLQESGNWLALSGHQIRFSERDQARVSQLLRRFDENPSSPPSVKEALADTSEEIYNALLALGELVQVSPEVVFRAGQYEAMVQAVKEAIAKNGLVTAAEVRDLFVTSRKYALALLEHLDAIGVTVRDGDARRLKVK